MAFCTLCNPCEMGDHENHYRVVQAVPEGIIGGAICACEGECRGRTPEDFLKRLGIRSMCPTEGGDE